MLFRPVNEEGCGRNFRTWQFAVVSIVSLIGAACSGLPEQATFDKVESAIAGGAIDENDVWSGVVYVRTPMPEGAQVCTGTLVAPNLVITALHCVAPLEDANFTCNNDGTVTQQQPRAGELAPAVEPETVEIRSGLEAANSEPVARGKTLITTKSLNICNNDLALLILDTELDLSLSRLRLDEPTAPGEPLTIVGYGMTSVEGDNVTRRYIENIRVQSVGADSADGAASGAPPRTFIVGASACKGDSGGPAFALSNGELAVAGVDSIIVGACGSALSRSIFTRLAPFKKLISSAFEEAGHPPWLEGQVAPGVDPKEPDAGPSSTSSGDDTSEPLEPARPARLTTGCAVDPLEGGASPRTGAQLLAVLLLGTTLFWRRRRMTPISLR